MAGLLEQMRGAQARQAQSAMSHRKFDPVTGRQMADAAQKMGLLTAPIPVVGDVMGLLGDAAMYAAKPEERTWSNYGLTALGALPFVPSGAGKLAKAISKVDDYAINHRPMKVEGGAAQLFDLTRAFGDDVYDTKKALQFYGSGDPREADILRIMQSVRGNPDAMVTIYRGVPEGVTGINPGDWVTLSPKIAADYGNVVQMQVPASDITSWADSLMEFGYWPTKK